MDADENFMNKLQYPARIRLSVSPKKTWFSRGVRLALCSWAFIAGSIPLAHAFDGSSGGHALVESPIVREKTIGQGTPYATSEMARDDAVCKAYEGLRHFAEDVFSKPLARMSVMPPQTQGSAFRQIEVTLSSPETSITSATKQNVLIRVFIQRTTENNVGLGVHAASTRKVETGPEDNKYWNPEGDALTLPVELLDVVDDSIRSPETCGTYRDSLRDRGPKGIPAGTTPESPVAKSSSIATSVVPKEYNETNLEEVRADILDKTRKKYDVDVLPTESRDHLVFVAKNKRGRKKESALIDLSFSAERSPASEEAKIRVDALESRFELTNDETVVPQIGESGVGEFVTEQLGK